MWMIFAIAVPVWVFMEVEHWTVIPSLKYCLNDVYCNAQYYGVWITLPFVELLIIQTIKSEFRVNIILRVQYMYRFWIRLLRKVTGIAFAASIYVWGWVTVIGLKNAEFNCNWNNEDSYIYAKTGGSSEISVYLMMALFVFLFVVYAVVWAMVIIIFWWNTWHTIIGFGLMIVDLMLERAVMPAPIHIFFSQIHMELFSVCNGMSLKGLIVKSCAAMAIMFVIGLFMIKKKDFLKKEEG